MGMLFSSNLVFNFSFLTFLLTVHPFFLPVNSMLIATDLDATAGIFDPTTDPVTFQADKDPVDYYLAVDRSFRGDLLLNNHEVVGFLSILEGNLTNHFLPKTITDFDTNIRTILSVSGTCLKKHVHESTGKQLLGDYLHLVVGNYHFLFSDVKVGTFIVDPANLQGNPPLPGDLEKNKAKCFMTSIPSILPLTKGAVIVEGSNHF